MARVGMLSPAQIPGRIATFCVVWREYRVPTKSGCRLYISFALSVHEFCATSCKWKQPFAAWQGSPSDFVRQPVASESTLCPLEGRMTTYSIHNRDSSLILDERGDRLA